MGKETARPTPEKETAKKKETGKQEGVLTDADLENVTGAGGTHPSEAQQIAEHERLYGGRSF